MIKYIISYIIKEGVIMKIINKKKRGGLKQKAGASLIQGPLDAYVHVGKTKDALDKHNDDLKAKMNSIDYNLEIEKDKYNKDREILANKKSTDDELRRQKKEDKKQNMSLTNEIQSRETERAIATFWKLINIIIASFNYATALIWFAFRFIYRTIAIILCNIWGFFTYIWESVIKAVNYEVFIFIKELILLVLKGLGGALKIFLFLIVLIVALALIFISVILFIMLIYYIIIKGEEFTVSGYKAFVENKFSSVNSSQDPNNPNNKGVGVNKCTDTVEISISNFSDWAGFDRNYDFNLISNDAILQRPQFPSLIEYPMFDIYNPLDSLKQYSRYYKGIFLNNSIVKSGSQYFDYGKNLISGGEINAPKTARKIIEDGRCDNIVIVEPKLMNLNLIKKRNINLAKSALNISKPQDIEWELPEIDYQNKDISELPPSLMEKKMKNGVSLNDKKTIVIPWVKKDDKYVLSCSDAYFKNNPNEKANILIDNTETTCIFNIENKPDKYDEDKERYTYSNDLSKFL